MVLLHMLSDPEQVIDFFLFLLMTVSWHINCNFRGCKMPRIKYELHKYGYYPYVN